MKPDNKKEDESNISFSILYRYTTIAIILWTITIGGLLARGIHSENEQARDLANKEASTIFSKDLAFRTWTASHGGVYVPSDERTPPNPYLSNVPERDITTTTGKTFTLMNHDYVMRQVIGDYESLYETKGHITSLKVLNPVNAPDEWERDALLAFEQNATEISEIVDIDGLPHIRHIQPLMVEEACIKCHGDEGYKIGEIRGGVSVSIPMTEYFAIARENINDQLWTYGIIFFFGLAGIGFMSIRTRRYFIERNYSTRKLIGAMDAAIEAIALTVEARDPYTAGHQRRVAGLAIAIAKEMGLSQEAIRGISTAGIVHDIGKVQVPSEILSKPGKLSEIEFSMIKTHAQVGYDILKNIEFPWPIATAILQHHEMMDGSGYPMGLSGKDIILEARILAVADLVEAMSSYRPYRPALGIENALEEIIQYKGILFDQNVVDACLKLFTEKGFKFE
jgi:putative nucleotidyltransferase with HDIG domain